MSAHSYEDLSRHIGHDIECVQYGGGANVAIECFDCSEVLLDFDHPENESPRPSTKPSECPYCRAEPMEDQSGPSHTWCGCAEAEAEHKALKR